jgi:ASC-1-like (ASCH) protein
MEKTNRTNQRKPTNQPKKLNIITNKKRRNKMEPKYVENLSEPWFTLIQLGLKTVEGRKNKGKFKEMKVGDIIEWKNEDFKLRSFLTQITGKAEYPNFKTYLEMEGLEKCLPNMEKYGIEHGLSVYYKYYTKEDEKAFGVVAIRLKVI